MVSLNGSSSQQVLVVNAGSSSIKFALYGGPHSDVPVLSGAIDSIGAARSCFRVLNEDKSFSRQFAIPDHTTAVSILIEWLQERLPHDSLLAIGHRIVYGGVRFNSTQAVSPALLEAMFAARSYDSEHLPQEQRLLETLARAFPSATSVACFDSAFHKDMPQLASTLSIPHRFRVAGVVRHGFHGLSCAYMMRELERSAGTASAQGKVVLAHLGGGCSVTAVKAGRSIDTSMGLTPAGGMLMATRSGDIDPGLGWRLLRDHDVSPASFNHMINHESGLKGISGTTGDLRELLARELVEPGAADAVAMFCYQARKQIGAMASALEGIDTLVFAGGIGEHLAEVRARICAGLAFLGMELDPTLNANNASVISTPASRLTVRVIASDEQAMIAEETYRYILDHVSTSEAGNE